MDCLRLRTVAQYGVVNVCKSLHVCEIGGLENALPGPVEIDCLSEFCKNGSDGLEATCTVGIAHKINRRKFRVGIGNLPVLPILAQNKLRRHTRSELPVNGIVLVLGIAEARQFGHDLGRHRFLMSSAEHFCRREHGDVVGPAEPLHQLVYIIRRGNLAHICVMCRYYAVEPPVDCLDQTIGAET